MAKATLAKVLGKAPIGYIRKKTQNVKGQKKTGVYRANARKMTRRAPRVRPSITPGTVLILLSGPYRGKRVIFLAPFSSSGLLLITGPFCINGVPLRRVNQRYVIATSTKVDLTKAGIDTSSISKLLNEDLFRRSRSEKNKERKQRLKNNKQSQFFFNNEEEGEKKQLPKEVVARQEQIDKPLLSALSKDKLLIQYLKTRFTLRSNMAPHKMRF